MEGFSLFNVSFGELILVLLLAALIMGPQRIRQVARWLGNTTAKFQRITRQFTAQLNAELDASDKAELKAALDDIQDLRRQVRDLRSEVMSLPRETYQKAAQPARRTLAGSGSVSTPAAVNGHGSEENGNTIAAPQIKLPNVIDVKDDPE